jgi:hypothetical protein
MCSRLPAAPTPRPPPPAPPQAKLKDAAAAAQWKAACAQRFVFSTYFDGASQLGLRVAPDTNGSA